MSSCYLLSVVPLSFFFFFFFSSRRRHTRSLRDWSSDVCSSDLGSDAIFLIENGKLKFESYYKLPAAQTDKENCVAHNGSLIPIPGRDVMVQAWYQGGISIFDWTDGKHPQEIAFFDRGPFDSTRFSMGGSWAAY